MTSRGRSRLLLLLSTLLPLAIVFYGSLLSRPALAPSATPAPRPIPDLPNGGFVYAPPDMDKVRVKKDIAFGSDTALVLDVYLPPGPTRNPPPVVLFVTGAGARDLSPRHWGI